MTKTDRCAEALLVGYGVIFWSITGWDGLLALAGAVAGSVGVYLNGSWRWSAHLRAWGILLQMWVLWAMAVESVGRPEFAAYIAIMAIGAVAFRRAARHAAEYKRAEEWKLSH